MALPLGKSTSPLQLKTVLIIDDDPLFQEELTGALVGLALHLIGRGTPLASVEYVVSWPA